MNERHVCTECGWTGESRQDAQRHERDTGHVTVRDSQDDFNFNGERH